MKRFKRNRNTIDPFLIVTTLLVACCFMSVIFSIFSLFQVNNLLYSNKKRIDPENDEITNVVDDISSIENLNPIQKMVDFAFSTYLKNCPKSDEIRPRTKQCLQNFGFQSSIFESLESLYLLNLTNSFSIAKKMVSNYFNNQKNFKISFKNNYVIRSELFNRAVASLIGSYFVSKDQSFINMVEKLVDSILFIDSQSYFPYPILDFDAQQGFQRSWENGTSIYDIVSGLPEILSLYKITKKDKYLNYVKNLLGKLKSSSQSNNNELFIFTFYNNVNGKNQTSDIINNYNSMYFKEVYECLLRSWYLINLDEIKEIIPNIILSGRRYDYLFFDSYHFSNYFNNSMPNYNAVSNTQLQIKERFEFDATDIRNKLRTISYSHLNNQTDKNQKDYESEITELVDDLMNKTEQMCRSIYGYSGLSYSNNKKERQNNIQHSSFFGNWINSISQALRFNITFWNHALFNTRGHLLYL